MGTAILPKFKKLSLSLPLTVLFMLMSVMSWGQEVSIYTDKDDYSPGEYVIIEGEGWKANEFVLLSLTHIGDYIPDHEHEDWEIQADENGNIYDKWYVGEQELGTTLWLQA